MLTGTTTPEGRPHRRTTTPLVTDTASPGEAGKQQPPALARQFVSSPRGARLARHVAVRHMEEWGYPPTSDASSTVALVVAELAANAVRHGRLPGRDFTLRLTLDPATHLVRIEIADAATTKRPPAGPPSSFPDGESGRGLLLVDALAVRWGTLPRVPLGKTVWAEVCVGATGGRGRHECER